MKTLSTLPFEQAHIVIAQLKEAGCRPVIQDQTWSVLFSVSQLVRIDVPDEELERAQELLEELNSQPVEPGTESEQVSDQQWTENRKKPWMLLDSLLIEIPALIILVLWLFKTLARR